MTTPATTDPAIREAEARGARKERAAMAKYLRREIADYAAADQYDSLDSVAASALTIALDWLLTREARYKRASGGLRGRGGR